MVSNWLMGEFSRLINERGLDTSRSPVSPAKLSELLKLHKEGVVSAQTAKKVLEEMFDTGRSASIIIEEGGLTQVSAEDALQEIIVQALQNNPEVVQRVLDGKSQAKAFLVGQIMKATKGRANPKLVNDLLDKALRDAPLEEQK
jgi:aspartyl-tRNA(Asn)/glutamyl-tRNA(Gln) amidotransferase subunit B